MAVAGAGALIYRYYLRFRPPMPGAMPRNSGSLIYRYYLRFRPPMPGAMPREGLVHVGSYDYPQSFDGISAWGYAEYNRELTKKEINDYELAASPNNPLEY